MKIILLKTDAEAQAIVQKDCTRAVVIIHPPRDQGLSKIEYKIRAIILHSQPPIETENLLYFLLYSPFSVNLIAFPARFMMIWRSLPGSPTSISGVPA